MTDPSSLQLRLVRIDYAAAGTNLYAFARPDGAPLPPYAAGAHVDLNCGDGLVRQYSLVEPAGADAPRRYVVGIKRDPKSRGGSAWAHETLRVGDVVAVGAPRCHFPLDEARAHSVFVAGGIGITPIACMARRLAQLGRSWELHYSVRHRDEAALLDAVAGPGLHLHVDDEHGRLLDVAAIVADAPADAGVYCCGPAGMLDAFEAAARARPGLAWQVERFAPAADAATAGGYDVRLAKAQRTLHVAPGQTILQTLRDAGIDVPSSCEQGICGSCETRVVAGTPDHRDSLLSDDERRANRTMMICCSGSLSDTLVLDL